MSRDCLLQCSLTKELTAACVDDPCTAQRLQWECCEQSRLRLGLLIAAACSLFVLVVLFCARVVNVYRRRQAALKRTSGEDEFAIASSFGQPGKRLTY